MRKGHLKFEAGCIRTPRTTSDRPLECKCNLICLLNLYIDVETSYKPHMKDCSVYYWNQNRNKAENKYSSLQWRYSLISYWFDYKVLCVCVKDRICLRMAIPAYCFNIFGSIFGLLFFLLVKKLILVCKTIRESFCEQIEAWVHFLIWTKKKHFFLEHCTLVWSEFFE